MDAKRLSLSNLHEQIDSLKSAEWPTMKRYFRRQIVKCINECKTQACNAKKLVDNIKEHKRQKGVGKSDDNSDDDIGWGSDFDDEDSDENEELVTEDMKQNIERSVGYNSTQSTEDLLYEPVCDYMSNGLFKPLDQNELKFTNKSADNPKSKAETHEPIESSTQLQSKAVINGEISRLVNTQIENLEKMRLNSNGVRNPEPSASPKPNPSPRLLPKPPTTKPEVPKNKPQIIPRKPLTNGLKTVSNPLPLKRPPSEPPPPPLPKSPPPNSPHIIPPDLHSVFSDNSSGSSYSRNTEPETYESLVTEDDYLPPIRADTQLDRKYSSSTISSIGTNSSLRDGESPVGNRKTLSSQILNKVDGDYDPFIERGIKNELIHNNFNNNNNNEENYEIVNDSQTLNDNNSSLLPIGQRPQLPKVKEFTQNSKHKLIPDVFPHLQNWKSSKDKNKNKERHESESDFGSKNNSSMSLDLINNNNTSLNNSFGISARPLPPLPTPPQPLSQSLTFENDESLREYEWFHTVEREDAEALLMTQDEDGAYLVRESKRAGKSNPYTLTIYHNGRVFHLNIRKRPDGLYALGKEKSREKTFKTVADLVSYHTTEPILLTTRGTPAGKTRLVITPTS